MSIFIFPGFLSVPVLAIAFYTALLIYTTHHRSDPTIVSMMMMAAVFVTAGPARDSPWFFVSTAAVLSGQGTRSVHSIMCVIAVDIV